MRLRLHDCRRPLWLKISTFRDDFDDSRTLRSVILSCKLRFWCFSRQAAAAGRGLPLNEGAAAEAAALREECELMRLRAENNPEVTRFAGVPPYPTLALCALVACKRSAHATEGD